MACGYDTITAEMPGIMIQQEQQTVAQAHDLCRMASILFGRTGVLFLQGGQPKADQLDGRLGTAGISVAKAEVIDLLHQIVIHGNAETGFFSGHS